MIAGVALIPLRQIGDERGMVMHMLRADAPHFQGFGEVYFSCINPGAVRAWTRHKRMVRNYAVPAGRVRVVLFDERASSATRGQVQEVELSPAGAYSLLIIPPMVWSGTKGLGADVSVVANCATLTHDPDEIERRDWRDAAIPYDWGGA